jgi:hypothetical protein
MTTLLAVVLAALLGLFLLALAGVPVLGPLQRLTWPIRWLVHLARARFAVWRELERSRAQWMHPASR